jgi:hypothetical protein
MKIYHSQKDSYAGKHTHTHTYIHSLYICIMLYSWHFSLIQTPMFKHNIFVILWFIFKFFNNKNKHIRQNNSFIWNNYSSILCCDTLFCTEAGLPIMHKGITKGVDGKASSMNLTRSSVVILYIMAYGWEKNVFVLYRRGGT